MSEVQTLNYSTHAIEDLRAAAARMAPAFRQTKVQTLRIAELIDQAVKFILPDNGDLVELTKIDEVSLGMFRLPFPLTVLEAPFPPGGALVEEGLMKEVASTKRITLAWDETFAAKSGFAPDFKEEGVYVLSVYYSDDSRQWLAAPLGLFIPLDNNVRTLGTNLGTGPDALMTQHLLSTEASTTKSSLLDANYFLVLPQIAELLSEEMGHDAALARMQLDVRDEMLTAYGFCLTVNCVNIGVATIAAPEKLNAKRVRNGKPPLYEYKVLDLPEPKAHQATGYRLDGSRNAPRTHLRRGHPRKLPDGRLTFVRAAVIGASNLGTLLKDYRVSGKAST